MMAAACATADVPEQCRATGEKSVSGLGDESLCDRFMARLQLTLGAQGRSDLATGRAFTIDVQEQGALIARAANADTAPSPAISIDVLDRPLRPSDIDRLADAVAAFLLQS